MDMSAAYAPELKVPSIGTAQITVTETTPAQVASPKESLLPHSITLSLETHSELRRREPMFGTHGREAASIFKDWVRE
jgi:hypothetical protein